MHTTGGYLTGNVATTKWGVDIKDDESTGARRISW